MNTHIVSAAGVVGIAASLVVATFAAARPVAQGVQAPQPSAAAPAFEAASVKPNTSGENRTSLGFQPGGRFSGTNVTLRMLIGVAYGTPQPLPNFAIVGGPTWIDADHFDLVAKAAGDPRFGPSGPPPEVVGMMRTLLADRFQLVVHYESRELPVYALVMARSDGKIGDHLRITATDCAALMAAGRSGAPPPPPGPDSPVCGTRGGPGRLTGNSATLAIITNVLSRQVNRVVLDRTGLTASYDFELEWTPDQMPVAAAGAPPPGVLPPPSDGPSLFTALQEQLGLKLESTKGPVDVLVIDRVEHPTPD